MHNSQFPGPIDGDPGRALAEWRRNKGEMMICYGMAYCRRLATLWDRFWMLFGVKTACGCVSTCAGLIRANGDAHER